MDLKMTSTTPTLTGYDISQNLGVVRGVTVRSRGLGGQFVAGIRSLAGGKIHEYVELCEQTRAEAFELMLAHAEEVGANAIVGIRYDATEIAENMTEVLAYGTAVIARPA